VGSARSGHVVNKTSKQTNKLLHGSRWRRACVGRATAASLRPSQVVVRSELLLGREGGGADLLDGASEDPHWRA
jgi:hypothetical protein